MSMATRTDAQSPARQVADSHDLIVFEGTPADLVAACSTLTGEHLAAYVVAG